MFKLRLVIRCLTIFLSLSLLPTGALSTDSIKPYRAGDVKDNFTESYQTQSESLLFRQQQARAMNLYEYSLKPQLGLPPVTVPKGNQLTKKKIELGRLLFFDRRLSLNDTFSCASCHVPEQGFTSNELATSVGIEGRIVRRNAPTIYNVGFLDKLFHDGREDSLELQVWTPLLAKNEMANPSFSMLLNKIAKLDDYQQLFDQAFDGEGITITTLGMALASYQRALIAGNSSFDQWHYGGDKKVLSKSAQRGFKLFTGKASCSNCHLINDEYALFTDQQLHNTGVGYISSMYQPPQTIPVQLAPGVILNVKNNIIRQVEETIPSDVGLYEVTEDSDDRWKFKTPSLRNVELTAPYMHDGTMLSLHDVMEFYNKGGVDNELLSPLIQPLNLSQREMSDLVAFMKSLTSTHVNQLVKDAFAAPIGDAD